MSEHGIFWLTTVITLFALPQIVGTYWIWCVKVRKYIDKKTASLTRKEKITFGSLSVSIGLVITLIVLGVVLLIKFALEYFNIRSLPAFDEFIAYEEITIKFFVIGVVILAVGIWWLVIHLKELKTLFPPDKS